MAGNFATSQTRLNLMRAFAGESQARNRYTFAAEQAKQANYKVLEEVFLFTANQELAHAKVFYDLLQELAGQTIHIDGGYPVDIAPELTTVLRAAAHNEFEEADTVYPAFAQVASEEGFVGVASKFTQIAEIERTHGERLSCFAERMTKKQLFAEETPTGWLCLNCGKVHTATEAPGICPVCGHDRGYFIRQPLAPYTGQGCL